MDTRTPALVIALALALTAQSAHALTYDLIFTSTGLAPYGTVEYANEGDAVPISLHITDPNTGGVYTLADTVSFGGFDTQWIVDTPLSFSLVPNALGLADTTPPGSGFAVMYFEDTVSQQCLGCWDNYAGSGDTQYGRYSFALVPEPTTALLLACGLVGLAAAYRRRVA